MTMIKNLLRPKLLVFGAILIVFPFVFLWLSEIDSEHGLIWFVFYQIYYLPLGSWMPEPLFRADSEVVFFVLILGKIITPITYVFLLNTISFLIVNRPKSIS
jgi:hypothetical protein